MIFTITAILLLSGFLLGIALEKAGIFDPQTVVAQARGEDMRILTTLLTATATSLLTIGLLQATGMVELNLSYFLPIASVLGGLMIGAGWVLMMAGAAREERGKLGWAGVGIFVAAALGARLGVKKFYLYYPDIPHSVFINMNKPGIHELASLPFIVAAVIVALLALRLARR